VRTGLHFQVSPRADCCTPATLVSIFTISSSVSHFHHYILYTYIAQSSRANGVEHSGQTTCGLLHTFHVAFMNPYYFFFLLNSYEVHVRTGLLSYLSCGSFLDHVPCILYLQTYLFYSICLYFLAFAPLFGMSIFSFHVVICSAPRSPAIANTPFLSDHVRTVAHLAFLHCSAFSKFRSICSSF
jgi:hypothetical protein